MKAEVKHKTFDILWMWVLNGVLMLEYVDDRKMSEIVLDWEGAEKIERISDDEGNLIFEGYTKIKHAVKSENDRVQIALVTEV